MKCAIFFCLLAFTSATPLMGWRNVETYGPQEFWNDHAQVIQTKEAIHQLKQYPHTWIGVPEHSRISQMLMNSQEFPEKQIYQTYQHPMPMSAHGIPLEQTHETFNHLSGMPMKMHQLPWEQAHETYQHFSGMPTRSHEIPVEEIYHHISGMPMNTHVGKTYQQFFEMHGIPLAHTTETAHHLFETPMTHLTSLEHHYGNMKNVPFLHHQYETIEVKPTDYLHTNQGVTMQFFHTRLQEFVEDHSEQEVQSLIVSLHHWTQELHHTQEVIGQQLSHVESRLMMLHHQQAHTEAYRQLQQVHHQLQLQRTELISQQLAHESAVEYLREALVHKHQHNFGTQHDVKHPFWHSA